MSDELERLENALRVTTPRPSIEARVRAVAAATEEFDRHHQGICEAVRHKGQVSDNSALWLMSWLRKFTVPVSRPVLALTSAAFLIVAGVVLRQLLLAPPAFSPGLSPGELSAPAGPLISLPSGKSASQLRVEPSSPLTEATPPPEMERIQEADVAEVMERIASQRREESLLPAAMPDPESLAEPFIPGHDPGQGRNRFRHFDPNPVKVTAEDPVSTFSIDVDTASYGFMRAALQSGVLPQQNGVRTEELINYFPYDYAPPDSRETPFAAHVSLMPAPWNPANRLLHVGIKGFVADRGAVLRANLVFLIDTSDSMDAPNKLPLMVNVFKLLLGALAPEDTVATVTYAGSVGMVLTPTKVAERGKIAASLERLDAGGSTVDAEAIRQAYLLAEQHFVPDGINRAILATDGDFNVGITDPDELESFVARKRDSGVFLSVLGFGKGKYNDEFMRRLAQSGNGSVAYIDSLSEARKVLIEEATGTLFPIAKDVKVQVEFNPAVVSEYRLIGYETRILQREDFPDDKVDAGEIGVGHTVTAIYEMTPVGSGAERIAPLRYQEQEEAAGSKYANEVAYLRIRYRLPGSDTSTEMGRAVTQTDGFESVEAAPQDTRFAAAVAAFGQLFHGGQYTGDFGYEDVIALAQAARGEDPFGYRSEFISLVRLAQSAAAMAPLPR